MCLLNKTTMSKQHQTFPGEPSEMPVPKEMPEISQPSDPQEPQIPEEAPIREPEEVSQVEPEEKPAENDGKTP